MPSATTVVLRDPPWPAVLVAFGGAAGAGVRWAVDEWIGATEFPWALLVVNVVGSFGLGLVAFIEALGRREVLRLGVGVGFCGGLTTFSAFAVAVVELRQDDRSLTAAAFIVTSLVGAIAAMYGGAALRHRMERS